MVVGTSPVGCLQEAADLCLSLIYVSNSIPLSFLSVKKSIIYIYIFLNIYFIDFVQRGRERDKELETSMRESHRSSASCTPATGDMPATKAHALDWNQTRVPSVPKPTLYPLSQTGFGHLANFQNRFFKNLFLLLSQVLNFETGMIMGPSSFCSWNQF